MVENNFLNIAIKAKEASKKTAVLDSEIKNQALIAMAKALELNKASIFEANQKDLEEASVLLQNGELSKALFNRLKLDDNKMRDMI